MNKQVREMSLREKIGQLFVCGFRGDTPDWGICDLISTYRLGGIIYFRRNVKSPEQVRKLSEMLQAAARNDGLPPLWIAIDQEGGMVARIDEGVAVMPGSMAIGAAGDLDAAYRTALGSGRELRAMGINFNFAPCLDVNNNPDNPVIGVRSYGESPEAVGMLGLQQIRGYRDAGVAASAKHFPGHGDTAVDSHLSLPTVPHGRDRLEQVELLPFRAAIAGGVDAIMTAHVAFPAYEPGGIPATISPRVIGGLLRQALGYDGVIITDCLEMHAIAGTIGVAAGAVAALAAGADLVLVSHTYAEQRAAMEAVYEAVLSGKLDEARIDESVQRVLHLKAARRIDEGPVASDTELRLRLMTADHLATAAEVCARSVTLVHNDGRVLPLTALSALTGGGAAGMASVASGTGAGAGGADAGAASEEKGAVTGGTEAAGSTLVVWPEVRTATEVDEVIPQEMTLGRALSALIPGVAEQRIGVHPGAAEVEQVVSAAQTAERIVMVTYNAHLSPGQQELARRLAALPGKPLTVVAARNPYDLLALPPAAAYIACYENRPAMMKAVADVLTGRRRAEGRLPVSLGPAYPRGWRAE